MRPMASMNSNEREKVLSMAGDGATTQNRAKLYKIRDSLRGPTAAIFCNCAVV